MRAQAHVHTFETQPAALFIPTLSYWRVARNYNIARSNRDGSRLAILSACPPALVTSHQSSTQPPSPAAHFSAAMHIQISASVSCARSRFSSPCRAFGSSCYPTSYTTGPLYTLRLPARRLHFRYIPNHRTCPNVHPSYSLFHSPASGCSPPIPTPR